MKDTAVGQERLHKPLSLSLSRPRLSSFSSRLSHHITHSLSTYESLLFKYFLNRHSSIRATLTRTFVVELPSTNMASISFDSELMTQQVAGVAIPTSTNFVAVNDENGRAMIFSIGDDGVFYLTKEDETGSRIIVNLSNALKIVGVTIAAFDVAQNISDSTLYVVVASKSDLIVLKPFKPSTVYLANPNLDLTPFIMSGGPAVTTVQGIYMVCPIGVRLQLGVKYRAELFLLEQGFRR